MEIGNYERKGGGKEDEDEKEERECGRKRENKS